MSQAGSLGVGGSGRSTTVAVSTFQPNVVLQEFDDFLGSYGGSDGLMSKLRWTTISGAVGANPGTITNPGIVTLAQSATDNAFYLYNNDGTNIGDITLGGGTTTIAWIVKLDTLSAGGNTYRYSCGLCDSDSLVNATDSFVDGVYFQYTNAVNAGQWTIKSTAASVTTTVNTAVSVDTSFHTLSITVNAAASSVSFYVDNVLVGSAITTNIPTASLTPFFYGHGLAGNITKMEADLFYIDINLTTPRPGPTFSQAVTGTGQLVEAYHQTAISYQVLNTDAIIGCSAGSITITMPSSSLVTGQRWTIKDESGTAAASNITVSGNGKNIDGAATFVMNINYESIDLYYNGSQFYII